MRDPSDITPLQADILELAWREGPVTAAAVRIGLAPRSELARTTVATMLARMEKYGWLSRVRAGREFRYEAEITRSRVRRAQVRQLSRMLFPDDLPSLVMHALREGQWTEGDLDEIEELVREYRRGEAGDGAS